MTQQEFVMTQEEFVASLTSEQRDFLLEWIKDLKGTLEIKKEVNDGN